MILTTYDNFTKINEFHYNQSLTDDELFEMANLKGDKTGLDDVVIWIGSTVRTGHGYRIKVSNLPFKTGSSLDCFTITIPEFDIVGKRNKKHVTNDKLNRIIKFIELNMEVIIDICEEKIDTVEFIERMKKLEE
jgi:hypothetical protein